MSAIYMMVDANRDEHWPRGQLERQSSGSTDQPCCAWKQMRAASGGGVVRFGVASFGGEVFITASSSNR